MRTVFSSALLASGLTSAALASPVTLSDRQMEAVAAGTGVVASLGSGTLNITLEGNRLRITGDVSALESAVVAIGNRLIRLNGQPLEMAVAPSEPIAVNTARFATLASSGTQPSVVSSASASNTVTGPTTSATASAFASSSVTLGR